MKNKIIQFTLALLALSLPLQGSAQQQSEVLTIEKCREMALQNSYTIKNGIENLALAEDILASYKANYYPKLSFATSYLYSTTRAEMIIEGGFLPTFSPNGETGELAPNIVGVDANGTPIFSEYAYMPDQNFEFEVGSFFTASLQIMQPIYMGGKISTATKLAKVGLRVAELERQKSESEVLLETDKAYYTYVNVEEKLLSAQKYQEAVKEFHTQITSAVKNGMATQNDLLKVQVKLNEAELFVRKAENGIRLARMNLCYAIGMPMTTQSITVEDIADKKYYIDTHTLDVTSRPEYAMLQEQVAAKELQVKLTKSDYLPSISAMASYGYSYGLEINNEILIDGNDVGSFTGGVMVSIPIFNWGEGNRKVKAGRHEVTMAKNQLEDYTQKMTLELMQAINAFDEANIEVILLESSVAQAEENMKQSLNGYTHGMETLANYLESQALWQDAMTQLTEAKSTLRISYVNYQRTAGKILQN